MSRMESATPTLGRMDSAGQQQSSSTGRRDVHQADVLLYRGSTVVDPRQFRGDVRERLCRLCGLKPDTLKVDSSLDGPKNCGFSAEFRAANLNPGVRFEVPTGLVEVHSHTVIQENWTAAQVVDLLGGVDRVKTSVVDMLTCQYGQGPKPEPADSLMADIGKPTLVLVGPELRVISLMRLSDDRIAFNSKPFNGDLLPLGANVLSRNPVLSS